VSFQGLTRRETGHALAVAELPMPADDRVRDGKHDLQTLLFWIPPRKESVVRRNMIVLRVS
jgi:hypothetical protein